MAKIYINPHNKPLSAFISHLPHIFDEDGEIIYQGRNVLKRFVSDGHSIIVKSYQKPIWFNRIVYRFFRKPKAQRSYEYAELLRENGIGSPEPLGYHIETKGLCISRTYFASRESTLRFTYRDLMKNDFVNRDEILQEIAKTTAKLHQLGILHKDYSAGNILFDTISDKVCVEIIDLNRIRFEKEIDLENGIRNFDRLPGTPEMLRVMSDTYADIRSFDRERCWQIMQETHGQDNKYLK